jgi:methylglutaconyl-CoA hydratase
MGAIGIGPRPDGCVVLTLDNPGRRNALDDGMIDTLLREVPRLAADAACRMLLIEGAGEDFCPGRDLSGLDVDGTSDEELRRDFDRLRRLAGEIRAFPKPIVTLVRGYALGLGAALVGWSDIALAAEDAKLGFPEVKVGIPPTFTAVSLLGRVPSKAALRLLLTGATIDGLEAERIGLVSRAAPRPKLDALAATTVADLLAASPTALAMSKALVRSLAGHPEADPLDLALEATLAGIRTPDAREGRRAFRDKRKPTFAGSADPTDEPARTTPHA